MPSTPRGTHIRFTPDRTIFLPEAVLEARRLHLRCRELAAMAPSLHLHFRSPGLQHQLHYPTGLAGLIEELTLHQMLRTPAPLAVEARWEDFRIRCAFQWAMGPDSQVWSFANTVRTRRGGHHVDGVLDALGVAIARVRRDEEPWLHERVRRGLSLVVAVDGPRSRIQFAGPTRDLLATEGLRAGVASALAPILEEVLRQQEPALPGCRE